MLLGAVFGRTIANSKLCFGAIRCSPLLLAAAIAAVAAVAKAKAIAKGQRQRQRQSIRLFAAAESHILLLVRLLCIYLYYL